MSLLTKLGIGAASGREASSTVAQSGSSGRPQTQGAPQVSGVGTTRAPDASSASNRVSNGLKELLWNLEGLGRGTLLDLGSAWQTTLSFFIERGFRVTSEDILRAWKEFLEREEETVRKAGPAPDPALDLTPNGRATRFLESNLQYPAASFDAVLLWDLLDYFEPALASKTVASVTELLRPGGVVFAMFHSKKPEAFQRYRVVDSSNLQVITAKVLCPAQRVYQNREIQDLFARYRTMKSFVGRDQLRETLFIK
jgi:cyclopropane fatty-acyl-phospholipid synthase-like methyltransferase